MSRFDRSELQTGGTLIAPAVLDADSTPVSFDNDLNEACSILIAVGPGGITFNGTNRIDFVLTHSDDDSAFEPVTVDDVVGPAGVTGGIVLTYNSAKTEASVDVIGYVGGKRYLRLLADFNGTHGTGTGIAAIALGDLPQVVDPPA